MLDSRLPAGPKGRFVPFLPFFWGTWRFSKNQSAAKSLLTVSLAGLVGREDGGGERRLRPAVLRQPHHLQGLGQEGPPKGTLYHYPNPHNHQTLSVAAAPAPHKIAEQIYNQGIATQMAVRYYKGEAMDKTLDWAAKEMEGFMRN